MAKEKQKLDKHDLRGSYANNKLTRNFNPRVD